MSDPAILWLAVAILAAALVCGIGCLADADAAPADVRRAGIGYALLAGGAFVYVADFLVIA